MIEEFPQGKWVSNRKPDKTRDTFQVFPGYMSEATKDIAGVCPCQGLACPPAFPTLPTPGVRRHKRASKTTCNTDLSAMSAGSSCWHYNAGGNLDNRHNGGGAFVVAFSCLVHICCGLANKLRHFGLVFVAPVTGARNQSWCCHRCPSTSGNEVTRPSTSRASPRGDSCCGRLTRLLNSSVKFY